MEEEISKTGQKCGRSARSDFSFNDIPSSSSSKPLQFFDYSGELGFAAYSHSEMEIRRRMMMMSWLRHSDLVTDVHHHQDLMERQHAVLSYMEETAEEAEALREENISLKKVIAELTNRLSLLMRATSEYAASVEFSALCLGSGSGSGSCTGTGTGTGSGLRSGLRGLGSLGSLGGVIEEGRNRGYDVESDGESPSPDTVVDSDLVEGSENAEVDRVSLPKSISVRSDRNLKHLQTGGTSGGQVYKQRVYVPGREKEKKPVELEVYNQGMFKTELCNKWQETGACPYGENCQFAHGIKELRPVLRHPRYKTEVCRMLLNGEHCPYGHRCHFRHTLTDEENRIRSMTIRPLKTLNII